MIKSQPAVRALLSLLAVASLTVAGSAQSKDKPAKPEPVLVAVVQVDGDYQVVPKAELSDFKKKLKDEHKDAVQAHKEAAKQAKKDKVPFDEPAPKAKKLKVVKPSIDADKADALIAELREKDAKKDAPKPKKESKPKKERKKKG